MVSASAGSSLISAYARSALRTRPITTAADSPWPDTSPITAPSQPEGSGKTSYQSPPMPKSWPGT